MEIITLPEYDDDEIRKNTKRNSIPNEGWVKDDEVFEEDREIESNLTSSLLPLKNIKIVLL